MFVGGALKSEHATRRWMFEILPVLTLYLMKIFPPYRTSIRRLKIDTVAPAAGPLGRLSTTITSTTIEQPFISRGLERRETIAPLFRAISLKSQVACPNSYVLNFSFSTMSLAAPESLIIQSKDNRLRLISACVGTPHSHIITLIEACQFTSAVSTAGPIDTTRAFSLINRQMPLRRPVSLAECTILPRPGKGRAKREDFIIAHSNILSF